MTDIKLLKNKIIFDGQSDNETVDLIRSNLAKSKDFKTVENKDGYAEFERIGVSKELKFAPDIVEATIYFDSHITKIVYNSLEWTTSGTNSMYYAGTYDFTVSLTDGYILDSVTVTSGDAEVTNTTDNSFTISALNVLDFTITITSKQSTPAFRFKHYSDTGYVTPPAPPSNFTLNGEYYNSATANPTYTLTKTDGSVTTGSCDGTEIDTASIQSLVVHTDGYSESYVKVYNVSGTELYSSNAENVDITQYITGGGYCSAVNNLCFVEGTLVTLADRTTKPIEDITYDDDLLVWNFYDGKFDSAKPFWIMKEKTADKYLKVSFSDGKELKTVGNNKGYHRMFNKEAGEFTHLGTEATPVGTTTLADDGTYPTIIKEEVVKQNVKYYNLATDKHFNFFANGILVSCRLSNKYHIENMKYVGEPRDLDEENYYKHLEANRK